VPWEGRGSPPIGSLNFRCTKDDKCWLNGKFCRKMSDEEGQKEFLDEEDRG